MITSFFVIGNPTQIMLPLIVSSLYSCEERDRFSSSEEDVDDHEYKEKCGKSLNKKQKKPGRKPRWSQELLNDFIDITVSTDEYKTKLILRNFTCLHNGEIYGRICDKMKEACWKRGKFLFHH